MAQGGRLLARWLASEGHEVRSEVKLWPEGVVRYEATPKAYSLPTILNGMRPVVSRDAEADKRSAARKAVNMAEAMKALQVKRAAEAAAKAAKAGKGA
jgi:hypothetical protein